MSGEYKRNERIEVDEKRKCRVYVPDGYIDDGKCETCSFYRGKNPCEQYEFDTEVLSLLTEPGGPSMDQLLGE